ncbi:MAG: biotin--[acetyl-CoA-carboxylase] ligase [Proteobacteria bacterium]|nr:biotin--[acetyl-CoA-carboxylase] ligase [Pseudomonadota bacterium]
MAITPSALLAALSADHAVSGAELARRLQVTRAAVWKQIEQLRELGAPVEAAAGRGYRLAWPLEPLDAARIRDGLDAATRKRLAELSVHWRIDSTSTELLRRASTASGIEVCLAETQSAGRGRRGREWQSPLGGNLYFSLLRRFDAGMAQLSGLSLVVGTAVVAALADCGVAEVGLKWPNDVLADGRKLAGILVELGGEFLGPCHAVIGIGINLRLPAAACARIDQPAIDLASLCRGKVPSRNVLAARLIVRLVDALDRFAAQGFAAFAEAYARCDLLRGRDLRVFAASAVHEGVGAGVDERGALIVRHGKSTTHYDSAEVSVRAA